MQTIKEQAQAVMAEIRRDAIKAGAKISYADFVETTIEGTVFKCVVLSARIYWYVDGKLISQTRATVAMEQALTRQDQRVTEALQRAKANAAQVAGPQVMITAQDVKQGDTYVTLFGDARIVERVSVDAQGKIIIDLTGNTARAHNKSEIVTVIRAKMDPQEISDYIIRNCGDYDKVPKSVDHVHLEAIDNANATAEENGTQEQTPAEFYACYLSNLVFVLTCTEFGTPEACEWFKARGVNF